MTNTAPPQSIQAWSFALPPPMQWATFDLFPKPPTPPGLLSIISVDGRVDTYVGVPQPTVTAFEFAGNQTRFFQNNIRRVYRQALLVSPTSETRTIGQGGVRTI